MPESPPQVARPLLRWFRKNQRDPPWRRTQQPYAIWIITAAFGFLGITVGGVLADT